MPEAEYYNRFTKSWELSPAQTPWYKQWLKTMQYRADASELRSIIRRYKDLAEKHGELVVNFSQDLVCLQGKIDKEQEELQRIALE